jgi:hypothetical protein
MCVKQLRGLAGDALGVERGVVCAASAAGQHHLLHALAPAPAHARGPDGADRRDDDEDEDDQREEDEAAAPAARAAAPPKPPPPPPPPPPPAAAPPPNPEEPPPAWAKVRTSARITDRQFPAWGVG